MNIEIYNDQKQINIEEFLMDNFVENIQGLRFKLKNKSVDFSSIKKLRGDKTILNEAFKQTKFEEINNWIYGD